MTHLQVKPNVKQQQLQQQKCRPGLDFNHQDDLIMKKL